MQPSQLEQQQADVFRLSPARVAVMTALAAIATPSFAVPVVYFQTIADGRNYFDTTVNSYADNGGNITTDTVSGLTSGTSWTVGNITITPTNGSARGIDASYLSAAPSLNGSSTGQAISMSASGSDPAGSGLTFSFASAVNAFGIELGDWGTCCYPSSLYIQFGNNGVWETAQLIGTATARTDVPEHPNRTYTFIGAINDTATFNEVRIYGNGDGDALYAGGVIRTGVVTLNSVPASAGSSTQNPGGVIDPNQSAYSTNDLTNGTISPVFDGGTLRVDSSASFAQDITVKNSGGTIDINGNHSTFSGVIADDTGASGSLTITNGANGGTIRLTGENTYTGGTIIDNGAALVVGDGSTHGSIVGNVVNNGAIAFDRADNISFDGNISGSGLLVQQGPGTLVLTGNNSYAGGTVVAGGTVSVSADENLGDASGAIQLENGTLQTTGTFTTARNIAINGQGTLDTAASTLILSQGAISGNGGLVKNGEGSFVQQGVASHTGGTTVNDGLLTLSGNNTYTGGTTLNGGTLAISSDANLGDASGNITLNGGELGIAANMSTARAIALTDDSSIFTVGTSTLTTSGAITGGGVLNKTGSGTLVINGGLATTGGTTVNQGTLVLAGTNTFTGTTTVNSGATVQVGSDAALGNASNGIALNNGTLASSGSMSTARNISVNGASNVSTAANTTLTTSGAITGNGSLTKVGAGTLVVNGGLATTGGTTVSAGTLVLAGTNTYTGGTTVNGGSVQVASDAALGAASSNITLNGGDLTVTSTMQTQRGIVLGSGNGSITTTSGTIFQAAGNVTGSGSLIKNGSGTLVMSGVNSYAGDTVINGGVVKVDTGSSLGQGVVTLNGGILQTTATLGSSQTVLVSGSAGVNVDAGTTAELSGTIRSVGSTDCFTKRGTGTLNMSGNMTMSKGTCVEEGMLRANGTLDSDV
ncbi:MAG: autotransporter-associated beta strand repeat-containing protein, partial [Rhodocyclaceae bacterium]